MNFLSRFAIPGLIRYVVILNALVFMLVLMNRPIVEFISLEPNLIKQGQVWRLVTWIFVPTSDFLGFVLYLMFTWWMGDMLEAIWGAAKLNAYFFIGMVACVLAAFLLNTGFGHGNVANVQLSFSLFLALATLLPEQEILVFFIFPVKLKWLALLSLVFGGISWFFSPFAMQVATAVSLANYILFFGSHLFRQARAQQKVDIRRARFEGAKREAPPTLHRCEACGITELTDPDADFRVTADGREFCVTHLPKS